MTLVVATGSFYLVEEPVRRGRMRSLTEWKAWLATSAAFLTVVAITVVATVPSAAEAAGTVKVVGPQYAGPPVKVAVLGDSVAWRLGFAMLASQPQNPYDVNIYNGAIVGCGVVRSTQYMAHAVPDTMTPACNSSAPASVQWPAQWKADLDQFHPNVVVVLAGRWELDDRLIDGHWLHIGDPAFDADLRASMEQAVQVATSTGALLVFMTSPCFDSGEQNNGLPWPEDSASRLAAYNTMVHQVATEHPSTVQVFDLDALLCPGGTFTTYFDGIQIRDGDGVHIVPTPAAGQWLDNRILPAVIKVGRLQMSGGLLPLRRRRRRRRRHRLRRPRRRRMPVEQTPANRRRLRQGRGPDPGSAGDPSGGRRSRRRDRGRGRRLIERRLVGVSALGLERRYQGRLRHPVAL